MVSSGNVRSDLNYLKSALNSYSKEVDSLVPNWKGQSSGSLLPKFANFVSEYTSTIDAQMSSFASACDLYEQFISYKRNRDRAQSNYNSAVANDNTNDASYWSGVVSDYNQKIASIRMQIDNTLASVISNKLFAEKKFNTTVDDAIKWAIDTANDDDWSYGHGGMGEESNYTYDCASFVAWAWQNAGVDLMEYGFRDLLRGVSGLEQALQNSGQFEQISVHGYIDPDDLEPGDIIIKSKEHAEMYIGDGQCAAARGKWVGDQSKEISVYDYSGGYCDYVYRYNGDDED